MKIVKALSHDAEEMKALWLKSFKEDDEKFYDSYWQTTLVKGETYLLKDKEDSKEIKSMLTYINKEIVINGVAYPTILIEGIATPLAYRRKGYMKKLLDYVIKEFKDEFKLLVIQAYNTKVYEPFGFNITHYLKWGKCEFDGDDEKDLAYEDDIEKMFNIWEEYIKDKDGYHKRTLSDFSDFYQQVVATGGYFIFNSHAYICMWEDKIFEIAYSNKKDLLKLTKQIHDKVDVRLAETETVFDDIITDVKIQQNTMLLVFDESIEIPNKMYFPEYV